LGKSTNIQLCQPSAVSRQHPQLPALNSQTSDGYRRISQSNYQTKLVFDLMHGIVLFSKIQGWPVRR